MLTGSPVVIRQLLSLLRRDFVSATALAALAILLITGVYFRSAAGAVFATIPVLLTLVWTLAALAILGQRLNLINVVFFPMIVGIGVDDAVHLLVHYKRGARVSDAIAESGRAILLTSLTTGVGFGSLALARTEALSSVGFLAGIGIAFAFVASVTFLPAALAETGTSPYDPH